ncbi:MAG: MerR family transcriptional regulator [Acidobacteriota bacterium]
MIRESTVDPTEHSQLGAQPDVSIERSDLGEGSADATAPAWVTSNSIEEELADKPADKPAVKQNVNRTRAATAKQVAAKANADAISPELAAVPDKVLASGSLGSTEEIPDKLYFRIGEVARLAGIKPYVLRFWESEFSSLGPKKSGTGHRLYRRKDVQLVLEIKTLLYEKRFTIEGARKHLETRAKPEPLPTVKSRSRDASKKAAAPVAAAPVPKGQVSLFDVPASALDAVRKELREILQILSA